MTSKDIIKDCVKHGDFTLKSGKKSPYYIDLRPLISDPAKIRIISNQIYNFIDTPKDVKICGLPYAGIPYACAISILYYIPLIMLRKEQKKHGTKKMIEGVFKEGDEIVIIDDILTTGSSVMESLSYFNEFKQSPLPGDCSKKVDESQPFFKIQKVIVILDREEGGREALEKLGLKVESLFKLSDLNL